MGVHVAGLDRVLNGVAIQAGHWLDGGYAPSFPRPTRLFKVPEAGLWLFHQPQGAFKGLRKRGSPTGENEGVTSPLPGDRMA